MIKFIQKLRDITFSKKSLLKTLKETIDYQNDCLKSLLHQHDLLIKEHINNVYKSPEEIDKAYAQQLRDKAWQLSNKAMFEGKDDVSDTYATIANKYHEISTR